MFLFIRSSKFFFGPAASNLTSRWIQILLTGPFKAPGQRATSFINTNQLFT